MPKEESGTVKKWLSSKGYGFITPDDGGDDIFVHASCLIGERKELNINEKVTFVVSKDRNGKWRAEEVEGDGSGYADDYRGEDRGGRDRGRGGGRRDDYGGGRSGGRRDDYGGDRSSRGGGRRDDYGGGRSGGRREERRSRSPGRW